MTRDNGDFVRRVADFFLARRGRGFTLSPADIALLTSWEEAGVPAETVLRGIAVAFGRNRELTSLRQCAWAVEKELGKKTPARTPARETTAREERLRRLATALSQAAEKTNGEPAEALRHAAAEVANTDVNRVDVNAIYEELENIEAKLLQTLTAYVPDAQREAWAREVRKTVGGLATSADTAAATEEAMWRAYVRAFYGLPPFNLIFYD